VQWPCAGACDTLPGVGRPNPVIAILDDEEHFRRAVARLLKAHGYEVVDFARGEELIAAGRSDIDCLLLDLHMPGMSGFDVLAALKRGPGAPPVIVISAHDDTVRVQQALALDAFEFQSKPVNARVLLSAIERACAR
jgi:two-component system response regulator FixJ